MKIITLNAETVEYNQQVVALLAKEWPHHYADSAEQEMARCLEPQRLALAMVEGPTLMGFVGAIPQYGVTGWELHPLVVDGRFRSLGVGSQLCRALEQLLKEKGCLTVYLGSDDDNNSTSLAGIDLFQDTFAKLSAIKNFKRHPYEFYQKAGYQIVGVVPDASGLGKPDIWLAKSLVRGEDK